MMDGGNGRELYSELKPDGGIGGPQSSSGSEGRGHFSGTDVDSAAKLKPKVQHGSLTAADRQRPASSVERSNAGSRSHHFVGSKRTATYADVGFIKPHHSHANVNISSQAVENEDKESSQKGDLSTVESSKSDTDLLRQGDRQEQGQARAGKSKDSSLTRLGSLLAKAVTLASADKVAGEHIQGEPAFAPQLNKCNSSSKTYEADMLDAGLGSGVRGSPEGLGKRSSAVSIEGERQASTSEGKRSSSHNMLGRIKILAGCLTSSDEGRSREDMTASSEDSSRRGCTSKLAKKKRLKRRRKVGSGEEVERCDSRETANSGTEVGKMIPAEDKTATGKEADASPVRQEVVGATSGVDIDSVAPGGEQEAAEDIDVGIAGLDSGSASGNDERRRDGMEVVANVISACISAEGGSVAAPVVAFEKTQASLGDDKGAGAQRPEPDQLGCRSRGARQAAEAETHVDEIQGGANKPSPAARHSGSSIELLCEYPEHVHGGEPVQAVVVVPGGQTTPTGGQPSSSAAAEVSTRPETAPEASELRQVRHHASAPLTISPDGTAPRPEIALKAVRERCRVLSERISDVLPGATLDDRLRLAVLGSFSYAAEGDQQPEAAGRKAASAPGPLEHVAQYLAEAFSKDDRTESSGIASFDGTFCDESSNHLPETPKAKQDLGSSSGSSSVSNNQDQEAKQTSSSDSSQDDYVQQMEQAQRLIDAHKSKSPDPRRLSSSETDQSDGWENGTNTKEDSPGADIKLIVNDYSQVLRKGKGGPLSGSLGSLTSSGYGSSLNAKIAEIEANLSISEGLGKPYKVDMPVEQDSVRKKELAYILKMLQNDAGTGKGEENPRDPTLLEAAVRYLYWSRHATQDLMRKPQQHQKVVMEDKLETKNLQLDLPPRSSLKGHETLEELKVELELRLKQIEEAIAKTQGSGLIHQAGHDPDSTAAREEATRMATNKGQETGVKALQSSVSHSSTDDSLPPTGYRCDGSEAIISSPGAALGSGILVEDCPRARKVRQEAAEKQAELEREREALAAQMKEQRITSAQREAHLLSEMTTLTKEYQSLMRHDQEHQQLSRELQVKLNTAQGELEQAKAERDPEADRSAQLVQEQLASLSFQTKETIHQLSVRLAASDRHSLELEQQLRQESAKTEDLRGRAERREAGAEKEREALTEKLSHEERKCSQLGDDLASRLNEVQRLTSALRDREDENRGQAGEVRGLKRTLEASLQDRTELQQQLQRADQKRAAQHQQWKRQRQELQDHLSEARASLKTSQLHLQTLGHTNQTLTGTAAQLQQRYQDLTTQLHSERRARETVSQDLGRLRAELARERKTRSTLVASQLSRWQQNLQQSTEKLSHALQSKICNQQQELRRLRDATTELNAELQNDDRFFGPVNGPYGQPAPGKPGIDPHTLLPRPHQAMHFTDWTCFDTEGGVDGLTMPPSDGHRQS